MFELLIEVLHSSRRIKATGTNHTSFQVPSLIIDFSSKIWLYDVKQSKITLEISVMNWYKIAPFFINSFNTRKNQGGDRGMYFFEHWGVSLFLFSILVKEMQLH